MSLNLTFVLILIALYFPVLVQYPEADLVVLGDFSSDPNMKLDQNEAEIKCKLIKAPTAVPQTFVAQWRCLHEGKDHNYKYKMF